MDNKIGSVPDFATDETVVEGTEEVKQTQVEEKETPAELPAESSEEEQKPVEEAKAPLNDDTEIPEEILNKAVARATEGMRHEIVKLKGELATARGADRKTIQGKIDIIQEKVDDLKDVAPDDVSLIDRVLRAKGYITKEESSKMHYDAVKNEQISSFLNEFPEYKPENDPNDLNWNRLQGQIQSWYRMPNDPKLVKDLLLKAHKDIAIPLSDRSVEVKKQQIKVASSGASGAQRSSPKPANSRLSDLMRTHMSGWSEEEISKLEKKLPE